MAEASTHELSEEREGEPGTFSELHGVQNERRSGEACSSGGKQVPEQGLVHKVTGLAYRVV